MILDDKVKAMKWHDLRFVLGFPKEKQKKLAQLMGFTSFEQWQEYIKRGHEIAPRVYQWYLPDTEEEKQERLREIEKAPELMHCCWIRARGGSSTLEEFVTMMRNMPVYQR